MTDTDTDQVAGTGPSGRELHLGWALVLISVAQLMVVLDGTIVNIALPYIQQDLSIASADLTWVVTGYALAFGSLLLLGGRLGDLYGRRKVFMIGLIIFAIASGLGGLATNEATLLAARGLQGLGAALASPAALALIATTFPAGPARNRAFAVYAAMSGAGAAVGLLLGGWLTGLDGIAGLDVEGWRLTLLINVPIGIAAAALRAALPARVRVPPRRARPARRRHRHARPARPGLRLQPRRRPTAGPTPGPSPAWPRAPCSWRSSWSSRAAPSTRCCRSGSSCNRTRAASFVAMFLAPAAMFAMFYFLSQYIQNVMGYSPIEAGLAFLPFCAGIVVAAGRDLQPDQPDRPALPGRRRHAAVGRRAVRVLPAALRHHLPGDRRHRQLRHRPAAVDHLHVARHGCDVRPAHADRRPPPAQRGLRHRLGRPQHDAAGRRRARAWRSSARPRPRSRPTGPRSSRPRPSRPPRPVARSPRPSSSARSRRSPVCRSSPRARPTRSWSAPG